MSTRTRTHTFGLVLSIVLLLIMPAELSAAEKEHAIRQLLPNCSQRGQEVIRTALQEKPDRVLGDYGHTPRAWGIRIGNQSNDTASNGADYSKTVGRGDGGTETDVRISFHATGTAVTPSDSPAAGRGRDTVSVKSPMRQQQQQQQQQSVPPNAEDCESPSECRKVAQLTYCIGLE